MDHRSTTPHRTFVLVLLMAMPAPAASQQDLPTPGSTVRFVAPAHFAGHFLGRLVTLTRDSITVEYAGGLEPVTVPLTGVTSLDVSTGTRSHIGAGVGIGVAAGLVLGAGIGALIAPRGDLGDPLDEPCPSCGAQIGIILGVPSGALLGAIVGAAARTPRWRAVSLEAFRTGTGTRTGLRIGAGRAVLARSGRAPPHGFTRKKGDRPAGLDVPTRQCYSSSSLLLE